MPAGTSCRAVPSIKVRLGLGSLGGGWEEGRAWAEAWRWEAGLGETKYLHQRGKHLGRQGTQGRE